jgi:3-hydroxyisobutyrate dehydrogenase-like beta-hydroxyacid dehydrogenase
MSSVSVLGTGLMGSALARAFLAGGHAVTVWNRTASRADALVAAGAKRAESAAAAFAASPLSIVCVRNYDDAMSFMGQPAAESALVGRTLLQLTTGTCREARQGLAWAERVGCGYLDGKIMSFPEGIGRPETSILVAGSQALFEAHKDLLAALGGQVAFVGEAIATAAMLDAGILTMFYGQMVGFLHALLLCEREGYPMEEFAALLVEGQPPAVHEALTRMSRNVQAGHFAEAEATVNTIAASLVPVVQDYREGGLNDEFPALMLRLFETAATAGAGREDCAALVKVLRSADGAGIGAGG